MVLVNYSDSEDSDNQGECLIARSDRSFPLERRRSGEKATSLPPLPDSFHDLYASTTRVSNLDDPSLHGGRQRLMPHVDGQWPTHVYIEWYPSREESSHLDHVLANQDLSARSEGRFNSLLKSGLGADLPLHISLSRSITLVNHERQAFIDAMSYAISTSGVRPFQVSANGLNWVVNDEKTRWFLIVQVEETPGQEMSKLLKITNKIAKAFKQPLLYSEKSLSMVHDLPQRQQQETHRANEGHTSTRSMGKPEPSQKDNTNSSTKFHVSIGWSLEAPSQETNFRLQKVCEEQVLNFILNINTVKVKIGNIITAIPLPMKIEASSGIIGV